MAICELAGGRRNEAQLVRVSAVNVYPPRSPIQAVRRQREAPWAQVRAAAALRGGREALTSAGGPRGLAAGAGAAAGALIASFSHHVVLGVAA